MAETIVHDLLVSFYGIGGIVLIECEGLHVEFLQDVQGLAIKEGKVSPSFP
jgi:hypothetical protein